MSRISYNNNNNNNNNNDDNKQYLETKEDHEQEPQITDADLTRIIGIIFNYNSSLSDAIRLAMFRDIFATISINSRISVPLYSNMATSNYLNQTILTLAAESGNLKLFKEVLHQPNLNINATNSKGHNALNIVLAPLWGIKQRLEYAMLQDPIHLNTCNNCNIEVKRILTMSNLLMENKEFSNNSSAAKTAIFLNNIHKQICDIVNLHMLNLHLAKLNSIIPPSLGEIISNLKEINKNYEIFKKRIISMKLMKSMEDEVAPDIKFMLNPQMIIAAHDQDIAINSELLKSFILKDGDLDQSFLEGHKKKPKTTNLFNPDYICQIDNGREYSLIMLASIRGKMNIVELLIPYVTKINIGELCYILRNASQKNNEEIKNSLWERIKNNQITIDFKDSSQDVAMIGYEDGYTEKEVLDIVNILLEQEIDPTLENDDHETVLIYAIKRGYYNVAERLLSHLVEKDLDNKNQDGDGDLNQLMINICRGNLENINIKNINSLNKYGATPLMLAVYMGRIDIIEFLLKNNADPNIKAPNGRNIFDIYDHKSDEMNKIFLPLNPNSNLFCLKNNLDITLYQSELNKLAPFIQDSSLENLKEIPQNFNNILLSLFEGYINVKEVNMGGVVIDGDEEKREDNENIVATKISGDTVDTLLIHFDKIENEIQFKNLLINHSKIYYDTNPNRCFCNIVLQKLFQPKAAEDHKANELNENENEGGILLFSKSVKQIQSSADNDHIMTELSKTFNSLKNQENDLKNFVFCSVVGGDVIETDEYMNKCFSHQIKNYRYQPHLNLVFLYKNYAHMVNDCQASLLELEKILGDDTDKNTKESEEESKKILKILNYLFAKNFLITDGPEDENHIKEYKESLAKFVPEAYKLYDEFKCNELEKRQDNENNKDQKQFQPPIIFDLPIKNDVRGETAKPPCMII